LGTNLKIAYFDQHRAQLDENAKVIDSVVEESDYLEINGQRKHVMGYLQDFLFSPERARQPVKSLSGGERNRLLLARVFAKPSNLLVLDEPTNDLDIETLELLEELVSNYQGTVLIVSHDRNFLNSVATSSIVFDAPGVVNEYVGGYDDWVRQKPNFENEKKQANQQNKLEKNSKTKPVVNKKLSYKQQLEYDNLPVLIDKTEQKIEALTQNSSEQDFYKQPDFQVTLDEIAKLESELENLFIRWEELESKIS
jgi:ATP-binding cassette subfamily F protein uup